MRETILVDAKPANATRNSKKIQHTFRFLIARSCSAPFDVLIEGGAGATAWKETFSFKEGDEFTVPDKYANALSLTFYNSEEDELKVEISLQMLPFRANDERIPPTSTRVSGVVNLANLASSEEFDGIKANGHRRQWLYIFVKTAAGLIEIINDGDVYGYVGCVTATQPGVLPIPSDGNFTFKNVTPAGAACDICVSEIFGK